MTAYLREMIGLRGVKSLMTFSGLIIYEVSVTGDVGAVACRHGGDSMVAVLWAYLART